MSRRVAAAVGLGYIGVDIVMDVERGPMLLEANARPGLAIQIANGRGLVPRLEAIDALVRNRQGLPIEEEPLPASPLEHILQPGRQEEPLRRSA